MVISTRISVLNASLLRSSITRARVQLRVRNSARYNSRDRDWGADLSRPLPSQNAAENQNSVVINNPLCYARNLKIIHKIPSRSGISRQLIHHLTERLTYFPHI